MGVFEQFQQSQAQEKIAENPRTKEVMGGENTMEVACATDKEPEERQTEEKPVDPRGQR